MKKLLLGLCFGIVAICFISCFGDSKRQRGRIIYTNYGFRTAKQILEESRQINNKLLPFDSDGMYYGPFSFTNELILDPNRRFSIFKDEKLNSVHFKHARNPDFETKYSGYPLIWCRAKWETSGVLVANGPDEDSDLNQELLIKALNYDTTYNIIESLVDFTYDVTNGTVSNGDLFRIVE